MMKKVILKSMKERMKMNQVMMTVRKSLNSMKRTKVNMMKKVNFLYRRVK
jgi:hypothetical protein